MRSVVLREKSGEDIGEAALHAPKSGETGIGNEARRLAVVELSPLRDGSRGDNRDRVDVDDTKTGAARVRGFPPLNRCNRFKDGAPASDVPAEVLKKERSANSLLAPGF